MESMHKISETAKKSTGVCRVVDLTVHGSGDGHLIAVEQLTDVLPFEVKRVYYIYDVKDGLRRGFHAHKRLKQLLVCVSGVCTLLLDDGHQRETITLDRPNKGVLIEKPLWREMYDFAPGTVLVVFASEVYDPDDYVWNYREFRTLVGA